VGQDGEILTSSDGTTWTSENKNQGLNGICFGNGIFVAVGVSGAVLTSPDGTAWTSQSSGATSNINGVCFGNSVFVAVGANGAVLTSPDGTTWSSQSSDTYSALDAVCYNNDAFVAVGTGGAIIQAMVTGQPNQSPSSNPIPVTPGEQLIIFTIGQSPFFVNGQAYNSDAAPFISSGRTLVPVRYLAAAVGAQTAWDAATQTITITKGGTTIDLTIGSTTITTNGKASQMDTAPLIENGRTYLPARDIAEALGYQVEWNAAGQTINIVGGQ
jgi:hypothetical protein